MGRRKIEIKAIKDDRNRSVTFLKRKGGLFKKAHELSVLCSVDVAVIIFGQNKKLYEFSSGQMQEMLMKYHYYQGPHEHKGPADFGDRGGGDEDDDDDDQMGSPGPEERYSPPHGIAYQSHPGMQQVRQQTPSASPPVQNGMYAQRRPTPQPQGLSRPSSRNHRRASSNLVPANQPQPQNHQPHPMAVNYGPYNSNPGYYQGGQGAPPHMQMHPNHGTPPPPQHGYPHQGPPRNQMRQFYMDEQRRQSMPPNYPMPPQDRPQSVPIANHSPPQLSRPFQSPPLPGSPRLAAPVASRSHSIYTPVDDSRSVLAQHWETAPRPAESQTHDEPLAARTDLGVRSQSIDVGSAMRDIRTNGDSRHSFAPPPPLQRTRSPPSNAASAPNSGTFPPRAPSRVNSIASDAKRPRLTVQIPSEQSDAEAATGVTESGSASSPKENTALSASMANTTPAKQATAGGTGTSGPSSAQSRSTGSVVLPPPSPSATSAGASGILSAGATGPKNPFARPLPPPTSSGPGHGPSLNTNLGGQYKDSMAETGTPMSALPSRFMSDGLLPSPSSFYPDWGFGGGSGGNNLASPAPYQPTPVKETGGGWKDEDRERERLAKRKNSDEGVDGDAKPEKKLKG